MSWDTFTSKLRAFVSDRSGATVIEYGVIGAFLSILIVTAAVQIGDRLQTHAYEPLADGLIINGS